MSYLSVSTKLADGIAETLDAMNETARRRIHRHRVYRATILELNALTDRDLADLGLRRGMIKSLAREAALRV